MSCQIPVLVHTPVHSLVSGPLTYLSEQALTAGSLVRVPLGQRDLLGVVWDAPTQPGDVAIKPEKLKPVTATLDGIAPLSPAWRQLVSFAAHYYQRSLGEVALAALPPQLRDLNTLQLARKLKKHAKAAEAAVSDATSAVASVTLTAEQTEVLARFDTAAGPFLLFGATGSGKTEVYLHSVQQLLARDPTAQAMVMVPEIYLISMINT